VATNGDGGDGGGVAPLAAVAAAAPIAPASDFRAVHGDDVKQHTLVIGNVDMMRNSVFALPRVANGDAVCVRKESKVISCPFQAGEFICLRFARLACGSQSRFTAIGIARDRLHSSEATCDIIEKQWRMLQRPFANLSAADLELLSAIQPAIVDALTLVYGAAAVGTQVQDGPASPRYFLRDQTVVTLPPHVKPKAGVHAAAVHNRVLKKRSCSAATNAAAASNVTAVNAPAKRRAQITAEQTDQPPTKPLASPSPPVTPADKAPPVNATTPSPQSPALTITSGVNTAGLAEVLRSLLAQGARSVTFDIGPIHLQASKD